MKTVSLQSLNIHPVGRSILNCLSNLDSGNYALVPERSTGKTRILKETPSHGTDFYKYLFTVSIPFEGIQKSKILPNYPVELNASPAGSDCQEYAEDALVFSV